MKKPTEFLQGFGIGASLIAVAAAVSLLVRPGVAGPGQAGAAAAGKPVIAPRGAGETPALLPHDCLDLLRKAGL